MQLIRANQKNTENLSFAKARIANEKQNQTKNEKIVETTKKNSFDQKTNREIHVQTLQTFDQI